VGITKPIASIGDFMQNTATHQNTSLRFARTVRQSIDVEISNDQLTHETQVDLQFMSMLDSYRNTGGLARAQEVFTMFKSHHGADAVTLARWIVRREVISFDWQSKVWIPLFQFDRAHMALQPGLNFVLAALNPLFGAWEMATWFAKPNHCLQGRTPSESLGTDAHAVLNAACADRFIAA
jgi:hypothetical protein